MKTATPFLMKTAITFLLISCVSLASHAAGTLFSSFARTNVVKPSDILLLDVATGDVFKTRTIAVSNLFAGLENVTIDASTNVTIYSFVTEQYVTNLYASNSYVVFEYVTNLYSIYANVNFAYFNYAYVTNLFIGGFVTNAALNASQYVATDGNKTLVSTRDGGGWTNLNISVLGEVTNAGAITFRDGVGLEMATVRGGGNASLAPIDSVTRDTTHGGGYWRDSGGKEWAAGFWTPTNSYTVGSIYMEMGRHPAATGTIRVSLFATSGGLPTGTALGVSSTINIATLDSALWDGSANDSTPCFFVFPIGVPVTGGVTYAMVLEAPTFSGSMLTYRARNPTATVSFSANGSTWAAPVNSAAYTAPYFVTYSTATTRSPGQLGIYADAGLAQSPTNLHFGPLHYTNAMISLVVGNPPLVAIQNGTNGPAALWVRGGALFSSNTVSLWPTSPRSPGDVFWGNSNGVQYQLSSGRGSSWLSTNQIGAGPQ